MTASRATIRRMSLGGRVAIVTGGGSGIGRAIALRLAADGAAVALCGTRRDPLDATAREITGAGGRAMARVADVASEAAVAEWVAATIAGLERIDILVNNAGIAGPTAAVVEAPTAEWERTLAINLTGAFLCAKHAIPHLVAASA